MDLIIVTLAILALGTIFFVFHNHNTLKFKIFKRKLSENWVVILMDLISLAGSMITILMLYFDTKNRNLKSISFIDLMIIIIVVTILIIWIIRSINIFKIKTLNLKKDLFHDFISNEVMKASSSIDCLGGDLSWLKRQLEVYKEIRKNYPEIRISIYHSPNLPSTTLKLIDEYSNLGIRMIEYPFDFQTEYIKGILIDADENAKFYSIIKQKGGEALSCTEYNPQTSVFCLAKAFIENINKAIKAIESNKGAIPNMKKIMIGVAGLNNIGKTTFCKKLSHHYEKDVIFIKDSFIHDEHENPFEVSLLCLINQIYEYTTKIKRHPNKRIVLFDRTPLDNLVFLKINRPTNKYNVYADRLERLLMDFMSSFDHIILLSPSKSIIKENTSFIQGKLRLEISKQIKNVFSELKPKMEIIEIKKAPTDEDIQANLDLHLGKVYQIIDKLLMNK